MTNTGFEIYVGVVIVNPKFDWKGCLNKKGCRLTFKIFGKSRFFFSLTELNVFKNYTDAANIQSLLAYWHSLGAS